MRVRVAVLATAALSACAAHMVSNPNAAYAPVNAAEHGGEIRYRSSGLLASKRREDAYKQMYAACGGSYRIDGESDRAGAKYTFVNSQTNASASGTANTTYNLGGSTTNAQATGQSNTSAEVTTVQSEYRYIHFTCVSAPTPPDSAKH